LISDYQKHFKIVAEHEYLPKCCNESHTVSILSEASEIGLCVIRWRQMHCAIGKYLHHAVTCVNVTKRRLIFNNWRIMLTQQNHNVISQYTHVTAGVLR